MYSRNGCHYSDMNNIGATVIDENQTEILNYMGELLDSKSSDDLITLADYGTADGGNILSMMNRLIDLIRKSKGPKQEISVCFEDQHLNDFNALVQNVMGRRHKDGMRTDDNIFASFSSTSMYKQCLPSHSLDFGSCTFALHWLSERPVKITGEMFTVDEESTQFSIIKALAMKNWRDFVLCREKELKAGGFIFVSCLNKGSSEILTCSKDIYKKMVQDGTLTENESGNTQLDIFLGISKEEYESIFNKDSEDMELKNLGLEPVSSKSYSKEFWPCDPIEDQSDQSLSTRATRICLLIKSWMFNSLYRGLSDSRTENEKIAIIENFFEMLRIKILSRGSTFRYINHMVDIVFKKQKKQ